MLKSSVLIYIDHGSYGPIGKFTFTEDLTAV